MDIPVDTQPRYRFYDEIEGNPKLTDLQKRHLRKQVENGTSHLLRQPDESSNTSLGLGQLTASIASGCTCLMLDLPKGSCPVHDETRDYLPAVDRTESISAVLMQLRSTLELVETISNQLIQVITHLETES